MKFALWNPQEVIHENFSLPSYYNWFSHQILEDCFEPSLLHSEGRNVFKSFTLLLISSVIYEVFKALILCQKSSLVVSWQFKLVFDMAFMMSVLFCLSSVLEFLPLYLKWLMAINDSPLLFQIKEEWNEPHNVCKRATLISSQL